MSELRRDRTAAVVGSIRRISWGAIVAGTLLALAIQFMLGLLGLGIGLVTINAGADITASATAFASTAGLWTVAVALVGLFFGAYACGRLAGSPDRTDALLHGVITWATATLVVIVLLISSSSAMIGGAFGAVGNSIQGLTQAAEATAPRLGVLPPSVRNAAEAIFSQAPATVSGTASPTGQDAGGNPAPAGAAPAAQSPDAALAALAAGLSETATPDQRQAAVAVLEKFGGLSQTAAEERLQALQQQYDQAMRQARQAAAAAANAVSAGAFGAFVSLLLGLLVGALGGIAGRPRSTIVTSHG
ncbi:hypothetical protein [Jiella sp. M17.18]|uniref:hypothetical protein n=1 Tax=Jiella sp. M17.18 TaxID=3234247 RepID=UPI0034DE8A54